MNNSELDEIIEGDIAEKQEPNVTVYDVFKAGIREHKELIWFIFTLVVWGYILYDYQTVTKVLVNEYNELKEEQDNWQKALGEVNIDYIDPDSKTLKDEPIQSSNGRVYSEEPYNPGAVYTVPEMTVPNESYDPYKQEVLQKWLKKN